MLADVLAIVAIVLSGASLSWQIITWQRSGAVITVIARPANPKDVPGTGEPHISITARNKGRSAVNINHWGFLKPDGDYLARAALPWTGDTGPCRLEFGASINFYVPAESVKTAAKINGVRYRDLIAYVGLGNGRIITAKQPGIELE